ncbi:MAG: cobalamin-binding protein [Oceanicaulis sp.]|jgi:iron complex transport system substrate-binding protein|uniref:ABC transporter substrate-binding protein n=1 Tax=unclassified Oceanicaulis TaxID=2632123 RepID=UPI000C581EB5|nr:MULTISPECIES: ABC transporter substrate-binding protein [unclassified Oceanicaulis]MAB70500.1 cobalamin-binding protein [Oceanicaulis sp.]MBC39732.1 cobalamin-binding protein [Oceanicaulis sp.]MBG35781.1 cobalamin-binding protein [Oceanicaulis sp.]HBU63865.1 cobalamin-binding protein [Oceanicaulis sp.]HCR93397.1 cobalamin-binding protein [Oceanicaulis sp.]|tara:strand:+ start:451 stop:1383 length:933 start_codon:yes stop_codon:yes gene_type:complete
MRIASLLASSTEIVAALDLTDDLVAVSHCCDWPPQVRDLPALTSALFEAQTARDIDEAVRAKLQGQDAIYALDAQALAALKPDLVISQALCDVCAVSGAEVSTVLSDLDPQPTLVNLEPYSLRDILETITMIGEAAGVADRAAELRASLQARIDAVAARSQALPGPRPRTVLLDWTSPPFIGGHWMHELLTLAGAEDAGNTADRPSWTTSWNNLHALNPERLVIAPCGFPAARTLEDIAGDQEAVAALRQLEARGCQLIVFDGNRLFSRSSPRIVDSLEALAHWLWPDHHPAPDIEPEMGPVHPLSRLDA